MAASAAPAAAARALVNGSIKLQATSLDELQALRYLQIESTADFDDEFSNLGIKSIFSKSAGEDTSTLITGRNRVTFFTSPSRFPLSSSAPGGASLTTKRSYHRTVMPALPICDKMGRGDQMRDDDKTQSRSAGTNIKNKRTYSESHQGAKVSAGLTMSNDSNMETFPKGNSKMRLNFEQQAKSEPELKVNRKLAQSLKAQGIYHTAVNFNCQPEANVNDLTENKINQPEMIYQPEAEAEAEEVCASGGYLLRESCELPFSNRNERLTEEQPNNKNVTMQHDMAICCSALDNGCNVDECAKEKSNSDNNSNSSSNINNTINISSSKNSFISSNNTISDNRMRSIEESPIVIVSNTETNRVKIENVNDPSHTNLANCISDAESGKRELKMEWLESEGREGKLIDFQSIVLFRNESFIDRKAILSDCKPAMPIMSNSPAIPVIPSLPTLPVMSLAPPMPVMPSIPFTVQEESRSFIENEIAYHDHDHQQETLESDKQQPWPFLQRPEQPEMEHELPQQKEQRQQIQNLQPLQQQQLSLVRLAATNSCSTVSSNVYSSGLAICRNISDGVSNRLILPRLQRTAFIDCASDQEQLCRASLQITTPANAINIEPAAGATLIRRETVNHPHAPPLPETVNNPPVAPPSVKIRRKPFAEGSTIAPLSLSNLALSLTSATIFDDALSTLSPVTTRTLVEGNQCDVTLVGPSHMGSHGSAAATSKIPGLESWNDRQLTTAMLGKSAVCGAAPPSNNDGEDARAGRIAEGPGSEDHQKKGVSDASSHCGGVTLAASPPSSSFPPYSDVATPSPSVSSASSINVFNFAAMEDAEVQYFLTSSSFSSPSSSSFSPYFQGNGEYTSAFRVVLDSGDHCREHHISDLSSRGIPSGTVVGGSAGVLPGTVVGRTVVWKRQRQKSFDDVDAQDNNVCVQRPRLDFRKMQENIDSSDKLVTSPRHFVASRALADDVTLISSSSSSSSSSSLFSSSSYAFRPVQPFRASSCSRSRPVDLILRERF